MSVHPEPQYANRVIVGATPVLPRSAYWDIEIQMDKKLFGKNYLQSPFRSQALAEVLDFYYKGHHWEKIQPNPTTKEYIDRINFLSDTWIEGLVAHHDTRYLGDLSGGQAFGKIVTRTFILTSNQELAFYDFPVIDNHSQFKENYRLLLDSMNVEETTIQKIIDESNYAFELNRNLFDSLAVLME
jgi:heme oxygenase